MSSEVLISEVGCIQTATRLLGEFVGDNESSIFFSSEVEALRPKHGRQYTQQNESSDVERIFSIYIHEVRGRQILNGESTSLPGRNTNLRSMMSLGDDQNSRLERTLFESLSEIAALHNFHGNTSTPSKESMQTMCGIPEVQAIDTSNANNVLLEALHEIQLVNTGNFLQCIPR